MKEINSDNDEEELPIPSNKKGKKLSVPESKDKLISAEPRLKRRRGSELPQKNKDEQIYSKNRIEEEQNPDKPKRKIQVEFMKPNGSSIYQTLLEFHRIYTIVYFIIEELLYIYKCSYFDFPKFAVGTEVTSLIFYFFIQLVRIYFGSMGNRAEASMFVILSIAFSVGAVYTYVHFFCLQTYVLRIELITNGVGMALWLFELIFGLLAFIGISGKESGI
jgi:transmembrane protein 216